MRYCFNPLPLLLFLVLVQFAAGQENAEQPQGGPMLEVTAARGQITVTENGTRQVINTVKKGTRLWALETRGDFYRVVDPESLRKGWIWKHHAGRQPITDRQLNAIVKVFKPGLEGLKLSQDGKFTEAILKLKPAVEVFEQQFGDNPHTAYFVVGLAHCYKHVGRSVEAELLLRKALPMLEKLYGPEMAVEVFSRLVFLYLDRGLFPEAEQVIQKTLQKTERVLGPQHFATANALHMLAKCYSRQARFTDATTPCRRALEIYENTLGPDHEKTGNVRTELAVIFRDSGDLEAAEPLMKAVLEARERALGPDHALTAKGLNNLAAVYCDKGRFSKAEPLLLRSLKISEKVYGPDHPEVANTRNNLASLYLIQGRYDLVEPLHQESLETQLKVLGPDHIDTATSQSKIANLYHITGRYDDALPLAKEALGVRERILGPNHPNTGVYLNNLASIYVGRKDYEAARPLFERALMIFEAALGREHPNTAHALSDLGRIQLRNKDYDRAESYFRQALEVRKKILGDDHPHTALVTSGLASALLAQKKYSAAEELYTQAIRIRRRNQSAHPGTVALESAIATLYIRTDDLSQAVAFTERALQGSRQHLADVLPGLPEMARSTYLATSFRRQTHSALTIGYRNAPNERIATLSAGWLLNSKGIPQEASAEAALLSAPEAAPLVEELQGVRSRLSQLTLKATQKVDASTRTQLAALETRQQQLQQKISGFGLGLNHKDPWISTGTLMSKIRFGSVLVNIARFDERNFENEGDDDLWKPAVYVAWLVPSAGAGDVNVVPLGEATKIDALIASVRDQLTPAVLKSVSETGEQQQEVEYRQHVAELSQVILAPLEEYLKDGDEIIISPDSQLWTIPWETLLTTDNQYVVEKYRTRYVLSGRELVYDFPKRGLITNPVIFADPDYELRTAKVVTNDRHNRQHPRSIANSYFPRLQHSAAEAASIQPGIEEHFGQSATVLLRDEAQEATFKDLQRPRALVMSTHGYFEPEPKPDEHDSEDKARATNPLLRCGLALAGCNHRASVAEGKEDGILTGLEIVGTDLRGTELVVLSACETGLGDIRNGDGVAGLRQAFQLAGAQSVISSLWQVEDGETARLMKDFFANLADGMTKSEALRQAKLTRIKARRKRHGAAHPFFWAAFTLTGME